MEFWRRIAIFTTAGTIYGGCATEDGAADMSPGEAIYRNRVEDGNTWSCATCHALVEPAEDFRRPAHPLHDAAARPSYKNGQVDQLLQAVNSCLVEWMNAEPWQSADPRWIDLEAFLRELAPSSAPALQFEIIDPPQQLGGGDPARGRTSFDGTCAVCHGQGGAGSDLAPPITGTGLQPDYVATRVRRSGRADSEVYPDLGGGIMPFWAADRLSDDELRDIVAFVTQAPAQDDGGQATSDRGGDTSGGGAESDGAGGSSTSDGADSDGADSDSAGNCPATHERVGWTAQLSAQFHNVGGVAEIVDDCTIVIRNFTYDGTGIDVRIYGARDGDYDKGFSMSEDLLRSGGYSGEEITAVVPAGHSLDEVDGISVWCVDVGVDFGSGMFAPPS